MWYVFEGGDLTGKTSLVQQFKLKTGFDVFHPVRPSKLEDKESWEKAIQSEMEQMEELAKTGPENMIMDRTVYISDPVYAPIFGRLPESLWEIKPPLLERATTWNIPHIVIYCYANISTKIIRDKERSEEKYRIEKLDHEVVDGYNEILKKIYPIWPVIRINSSYSNLDECITALMAMLDYLGELRCEPTHSVLLSQWLKRQTFLLPLSRLQKK